MKLRLILVCIVVLSINIANANPDDVEVLNRATLKSEIDNHLENHERAKAFVKYKKLAFTGDADSMFAIAELSNDKTFEYFNLQNAYYYYVEAAKKGSLASYEPLILMLIDNESEFYNLTKAQLFASGYLAKKGDGAESLLSYVLWLNRSDDHQRIKSLADTGYQKKQPYSVLVLAHIYELGIGVEKNLTQSIAHFNKAKVLGFEVDEDLKRASIKKHSPSIGDFHLYGASRDLVTEVFISLEAHMQKTPLANLDLFTFKSNVNSINSATLLYSSDNKLGEMKYVLNADKGRFKSLKSSMFSEYGKQENTGDNFHWMLPNINVSLGLIEKCTNNCDGKQKSMQQFIEIDYVFLNVDLKPQELGNENASTFKF